MRKLFRPTAQLHWLHNALCVRQGNKLQVVPFGDRGLELRVEAVTDVDHYRLVAIPAEGEARALATFTSERQAQRLLNQLSGAGPRLGTWLTKAGVVAGLGFASWFLFVLPIDAEFTRQHQSRWLQEQPLNSQRPVARLHDPVQPARAAQAQEAATAQLSPALAPVVVEREQQLQQAFGLGQ